MKMTRKQFLDTMSSLLQTRRVTFIGDSMVDIWRRYKNPLPSPEGSHPKVPEVRDVVKNLGGTANISRIAKELGAYSHLVTGLNEGLLSAEYRLPGSQYYLDEYCDTYKDMCTELSVKERILINNNTILRIDRDYSGEFSWKKSTFVGEILQTIKNASSDNIVIQDYGKGCVTNIKRALHKLRTPNSMLIYGPHITSRPFRIGADVVKMNSHEFKKLGLHMDGVVKLYDIRKALIVTHPEFIECSILNDHAKITDHLARSGLYVDKPNVVGAGDIVMGLISKISHCQWQSFVYSELKLLFQLIAGLASLKCEWPGIGPDMSVLAGDYFARHIDKTAPGEIIGCEYAYKIGIVHKLFLKNKIILINGTFDRLHPGHFTLFERAAEIKHRENNAILVVAINSDISYTKLKKHKPTFPENHRVRQVACIKGVDYVIPFNEEGTLNNICEYLKPIMIKGEDYRGKLVTGETHCENIIYVPRLGGYSSSKLE